MPMAPAPQLKAGLFARNPNAKPKDSGPAAPKAAGPKGFPVEHRIGIQASAETIWDLIYDLAGWSAWNPLYPEASGDIRIGSTLTLTTWWSIPEPASRSTSATVKSPASTPTPADCRAAMTCSKPSSETFAVA